MLGAGARPGVAEDAVAHLLGEVQPASVALEVLDDPKRLAPMLEAAAEALAQAAIEDVLADVPERRVAEVVPDPDGLDEILVEAQRARDRPRNAGDLERVRQARAEVIALGSDEDLRLVLQTPERLGVHDAVTVALERRAQPAIGFGLDPARRIRARRGVREDLLLELRAGSREGCPTDSMSLTTAIPSIVAANPEAYRSQPSPQRTRGLSLVMQSLRPLRRCAQWRHFLLLGGVLVVHGRRVLRCRETGRSGRVDP